ncbi:MAG: hypothetical protein ACE10D_12995 [Planctomycetota bacterium]
MGNGNHKNLLTYAKTCFDYTLKSNQNEIGRIQMIIGTSIGALAVNRYLLEQIETRNVGSFEFFLRTGVFVSSLLLLAAAIWAIILRRSRTLDDSSPMLPERIKEGTWEAYSARAADTSDAQVIQNLFRETHALAIAKTIRSKEQRPLRIYTFLPAIVLMVLVYFVLFLWDFPPHPS